MSQAEDKPKFSIKIRHGKETLYEVTIGVDDADAAKEWGKRQAEAMGIDAPYISVREVNGD